MTSGQPHPEIALVSGDTALAETIGERLREWGLTTRLVEDVALLEPDLEAATSARVVILDIRREAAPSLRWLKESHARNPAPEVILVNNPDRMTTSLEGMRAGAAAELTLPIDLGEMRRVLMTALSKIGTQQGGKRGNKFSRFFRQTMAAITYAQAGEFETALDFMDDPDNQAGKARPRGKR
jgi:DNA-binding NtrC family response regulator